jgi:hypothetical protein
MNLDLIFHHSDISDFGKTRVQHLIYKNLTTLYGYNFNIIHPYTLDTKMMENPANLKSMLMFIIKNKPQLQTYYQDSFSSIEITDTHVYTII